MASYRAASRPSSPADSRRTLAIDYGRRRIGLAISDELGLTASPLTTIERKNRREDFRRLRDIARQHKISFIIVGYPLHLAGHSGAMAEEAARFAARIRKELGLPVELRDERLTSWEAAQISRGSTGRRRGKTATDSLAAAILLRAHLDEMQIRKSSKDKA